MDESLQKALEHPYPMIMKTRPIMTNNKIAIFPYLLRGKIPFGFSFGWYFKDDKGEYCIVFSNSKTREKANEALKREKPDVELVNLDYEPPTYRNKKPMDYYIKKT